MTLPGRHIAGTPPECYPDFRSAVRVEFTSESLVLQDLISAHVDQTIKDASAVVPDAAVLVLARHPLPQPTDLRERARSRRALLRCDECKRGGADGVEAGSRQCSSQSLSGTYIKDRELTSRQAKQGTPWTLWKNDQHLADPPPPDVTHF